MVKIIKNPLVQQKMGILRDKNTSTNCFRKNLYDISQLMTYEVTNDYAVSSFNIHTPFGVAKANKIKDNVVIITILRAGLGMMEGFKVLINDAILGYIAMARDEKTLIPTIFYQKLPKAIKGANVIIVDPMLATGNSSLAAIKIIDQMQPKNIKMVTILASQAGVKKINDAYKDIIIYTTAIDKLDSKGWLIPGLGDAGDRLCGTN